jgi:hypothetical protein
MTFEQLFEMRITPCNIYLGERPKDCTRDLINRCDVLTIPHADDGLDSTY